MNSMDKKVFFLVAFFCLVSFVVNIFFLSRFPLVLGHDGAYYLNRTIQFRQGALIDPVIHSPPVFFLLSSFFSSFFELNFSINLVASIFAALLGLSVFFLARLLFKDDWIAIATALLVLFSRQEIILLTELKKNILGLFFVPLFFFFFFKASEKKRFLLAAFLVLVLGFFSHKAALGVSLLILFAFIPLQFAFERKPTAETRNFAILVAIALLAFSVIFLFNEPFASRALNEATNWLNETRDAKADVNLSGYGVVFLAALAGLLFCFARCKKQHLFVASWFLVLLWASFPFISGSESWRFALMLILPVAFLAGFLLLEVKQRFASQKFAIVFVVLFAFSLLFFVKEFRDTKAVFTQADYTALTELNAQLAQQKPCIVFAAGTTFYWAEYLLKNCSINSASFPGVFNESKKLALAGTNAFVLVDANPEKRELALFDANHFEQFAQSGTRVLLKSITNSTMPENAPAQKKGYNFSKLLNPFALLFFPTELPLLLNAPFAIMLRVFVGIPASFAVFGFVLLVFHKKLLIKSEQKN